MPALTVDPVEWAVVIHGRTYAIIRRVELDGEEYWRVVTGENDRTQRRVVGYWGSFDEAGHNALAWVEQQLPPAWLATGGSTRTTPRSMTPQKPPPPAREAQPRGHGIPRGVDTVWGTHNQRTAHQGAPGAAR